jgi:PAS domain S-box-containing protein
MQFKHFFCMQTNHCMAAFYFTITLFSSLTHALGHVQSEFSPCLEHQQPLISFSIHLLLLIIAGDRVISLQREVILQRRIEKELTARNQFIESLVGLTPGILHIYDIPTKKFLYSNGGVQQILGYSIDEIEAMGDQQLPFLMHPDDYQYFLQNTVPRYACAKDSEPITHQFRIKHKSGEWRWLNSNETIYLRESDGKPRQIICLINDITANKLTENALLESERKYRYVFDTISEGIFQSTPAGQITSLNPAFAKNLRYGLPDVMRKNATNLYIFPDDRVTIQHLLAVNGSITDYEVEMRQQDGGTCWVTLSIRAEKDNMGNIIYYEGTQRNITDRKIAELTIKKIRSLDAITRNIMIRLINSTSSDLDKNIEQCLEEIASFFGAELSYMIHFHDSQYSITHEWCATDIESQKKHYQNVPLGLNPWIEKKITTREIIVTQKINDLPPEASSERERWVSFGYKSMMQVPFCGQGGTVIGGIAMYSIGHELDWTKMDACRLEIVANAIATSLEHKSADEALRQSEEKFLKAFRSSPDVMAITSIDEGKFIEVNDNMEKFTGFAREEIIGKSVHEFNMLDDPSQRDRYVARLIRDGFVRDWDVKFQLKPGKIIDALLFAEIIELKNGKHIICTARDITQRKQADKALLESEERYRRLLESITGYVFSVDIAHENRITAHHSEGCFALTGYHPADFETNKTLWFSLVPTEDNPAVRLVIDRFMQDKKPQSLQHRIIHRNGSRRWVELTLVPHLDEFGTMLSYDGLISDITSRKVAELALQESEERFRQMAENMEEFFFLCEKTGDKVLYISPLIERAFGDMQHAVKNRSFIVPFIHPDDLPNVYCTDPEQFYSRPLNEVFRIILPSGELYWIRLRSFLIRDELGNVKRVAGLAADITSQKLAAEKERLHAEQLQQTDKMVSLGILVSGVAHEVNNPNNFIMLNTPLLKDAWEQARPILENHFENNGDFELGGIPFSEMCYIIPDLFDGIEDGSRRIKNIVENLKNFARKDVNNFDDTIDVVLVVKDAVSLLNSMINKKTEKFSLNMPDTPVFIKGNKQKLEQVIINLIHNACDALESKEKSIRVTVEGYTDECIISIVDEGKGIPAPVLLQLTQPFFTTKREHGGTGLGLTVSAGIVKSHKGKLLFESEVDKGTKAMVILPISHTKVFAQ